MNDIYSPSTEATWENDNADLRHDRNNNNNDNNNDDNNVGHGCRHETAEKEVKEKKDKER